MASADDIATKVSATTEPKLGDPILVRPVVSFRGWVANSPLQPAAPADGDPDLSTFRLFTDPCFSHWLEIPNRGLVHQVTGAAGRDNDQRSRVWVRADTPIVQCQVASAQYFADVDRSPNGGDYDDPAAGYGGGRDSGKGGGH